MKNKKNTSRKTQVNRVCLLNGKPECALYHKITEPNETPTILAGFGYRSIMAFVSWLVLSCGISEGSVFFASLILYQLPLYIDILRYMPTRKECLDQKAHSLIVSCVVLLLGFLGVIPILTIQSINDVLYITTTATFVIKGVVIMPVYALWAILVVSPIMTVRDWIVNKSTFEDEVVSETKDMRE